MSVNTVDVYIAKAPKNIRNKLNALRSLIKEITPTAQERISYGMPFYDYHGRLVYFALMKHHIGLYIPPPIIEQFAEELRNYKTTKSAIHLPLDEELPKELIEKLVKARMKWNEHKISSN